MFYNLQALNMYYFLKKLHLIYAWQGSEYASDSSDFIIDSGYTITNLGMISYSNCGIYGAFYKRVGMG